MQRRCPAAGRQSRREEGTRLARAGPGPGPGPGRTFWEEKQPWVLYAIYIYACGLHQIFDGVHRVYILVRRQEKRVYIHILVRQKFHVSTYDDHKDE